VSRREQDRLLLISDQDGQRWVSYILRGFGVVGLLMQDSPVYSDLGCVVPRIGVLLLLLLVVVVMMQGRIYRWVQGGHGPGPSPVGAPPNKCRID